MEAKMQRFLVRRGSGDVFIWTAELAKRDDLEEVFAENVDEALKKEAMPDPRKISLDQLEGMGKTDLLIFARLKLGMDIPASKTIPEIQDLVKEKLFTRASEPETAPQVAVEAQPEAGAEVGPAKAETRPLATAKGAAGV